MAAESLGHRDDETTEAQRGMRELEAYLGQNATFAAYLDARDRTDPAARIPAREGDGQSAAAPRSRTG